MWESFPFLLWASFSPNPETKHNGTMTDADKQIEKIMLPILLGRESLKHLTLARFY